MLWLAVAWIEVKSEVHLAARKIRMREPTNSFALAPRCCKTERGPTQGLVRERDGSGGQYKQWRLCSGCGRSSPARELTVSTIKPTFAAVAGAGPTGSNAVLR